MISDFINCPAGMFECEWTVYGMCEWMMIYEGGGGRAGCPNLGEAVKYWFSLSVVGLMSEPDLLYRSKKGKS
jgi:hypothetical protein